jgi:hypothetical protein
LDYLEQRKSKELIEIYKINFRHILTDKYYGISTIHDNDEQETYYISSDLNNINKFLIPFQAFDIELNKNLGIIYLENILKHTAYILEELKTVPEKESDVYNSIKHVINSTFPDFMGLTESFYKEAKHYVPDILIPSLNCAVEYKYAKNLKRVTNTIEEILIDVQGYSNHHMYKLFYAVFYVKVGVCTQERFTAIWNGYNFPNNWKPILVLGK